MPTVRIICNLEPRSVVPFLDHRRFYDAFTADPKLKVDPNVPPEELSLGFASGGKWHPGLFPTQEVTYVFDNDSASIRTNPGNQIEVDKIPLVRRERIKSDELKRRVQVVPSIVATLALFKPGMREGEQVTTDHVMRDANDRIIENVISGGTKHAENLDLRTDSGLQGFYEQALMMDTGGRNPRLMSRTYIEDEIRRYGIGYEYDVFYIGAGSEHLPQELRQPGALNDRSRHQEYVDGRHLQFNYIEDYGNRTIVFPDRAFADVSVEDVIAVHEKLFSSKPGARVFHILGGPFDDLTKYADNEEVLKKVAPLARLTKTSTPYLTAQQEYYRIIAAACSRMVAGDDRNWDLVWAIGANELASKIKSGVDYHVDKRDGFTFAVDSSNIGGLLGYYGLNLYQTIAAINELSGWVESTVDGCKEKANAHLLKYFELTTRARGMSTDVFFGPTNPTSAYPHFIRLANIITGVIKPEGGNVLPERDSKWVNDVEKQKFINGRLLVWMLLCGAITTEEAANVIQVYPDLFNAKVEK